jgi:hypothetical protein
LDSQDFAGVKEAADSRVMFAVVAILGYIFMKPTGNDMLCYYLDRYVEPVLRSQPVARYVYDIAMKMERKGEYFTRVFILALVVLVCHARVTGLDDKTIASKSLSLVAQMEKKLLWRRPGQKSDSRFERENGYRILFLGIPSFAYDRSAYLSYMADIVRKCVASGCIVFLLVMQTEGNAGAIETVSDLAKICRRDLLNKQIYNTPGVWKKSPIRHACIAWKSPSCGLP